VRSLVAAAGIINQFPVTGGNGLDRLAFWQHSIGTAVCAQVLAKAQGKNQALAFTAGLLHDIGRLVLDEYFHAESSAVVARCAAEDLNLFDAECAEIGKVHGMIGYELVKRWKFPVSIQQAIRDHFQPERDSAVLTDLAHVANVLCHALDIGNAGYDEMVPPLSSGSWTRLGLDWDAMPVLLAEIERQYAGAHLLLGE
jgi:putative nucleotidyltransferase with HDIG domain